MKRALQVIVCAGSVSGGVAVAGDANPRCEAIERSTEQVKALVATARDGRLQTGQLRAQRRREEARLEHQLDALPVDLKPGDLGAISRCSAALNQALIESHELEFFGSVARPEWGWYPDGVPHTAGSTRTAQTARVEAAHR